MTGIKAFNPPEVGTEEHIIRRLGWAVVRQWANLSVGDRELIQEQAVFTESGGPTVQLNEQIKLFIGKYSGTP